MAVFCAQGACEDSPPAQTAQHATTLDDVQADFAAGMERAKEDLGRALVAPTCPATPPARTCGLLWKAITPDGIATTIKALCGETPETADDISAECLRRFFLSFAARVKKRYNLADPVAVDRKCEVAEGRCQDPQLLELEYLVQHNDAALRRYERTTGRLLAEARASGDRVVAAHAAEAAEERDEADRRRALAAFGSALSAMGQSMSRPPSATAGVTPSSNGCGSDFDCGGPGYVCVKAPGRSDGTCARSVNAYGNPDLRPPTGSSVGPGHADCDVSAECPPAFQCREGHCMRPSP
jgi:hypothetical protein